MTRVAKRVRLVQIRELQGLGYTVREIGWELGLQARTIYAYLNDPDDRKVRARRERGRRVCPDCGGPMSAPGGRGTPQRCRACNVRVQKRSRKWTAESVVAALQRFGREQGRRPVATDCVGVRPAYMPPLAAVYCSPSCRAKLASQGSRGRARADYAPFDSWGDALQAAGFERPMVGWWRDREAQLETFAIIRHQNTRGPGGVLPTAERMLEAGGAVTIGELAVQTGCAYGHAAKVLRELKAQGRARKVMMGGYAVYLAVEEAA